MKARDKILAAIATFDDERVRSSMEQVAEVVIQRHQEGQAKNLRTALKHVMAALPTSVTAEDLAGEVRSYLAELDPSTPLRHNKVRIAAELVLALAGQTTDACPELDWIREHSATLARKQRPAKLVSKLLSSGKPVSFFRPLSVKGGKTLSPAVLLEFDTDAQCVQDVVVAAFTGVTQPQLAVALCSRFSESLGGGVPDALDGFTAQHLERQMAFFAGSSVVGAVATFYVRAAEESKAVRRALAADGVTMAFLTCCRFARLYAEGYRAVAINPLDEPPELDRWAVYPNGTEDDYAEGKPNKAHAVDFSRIAEEDLRRAAKRQFWGSDVSLPAKCDQLRCITEFLDLYRPPENALAFDGERRIRPEDVEAFLLEYRRTGNNVAFAKSALAGFIDTLEGEQPEAVDPLCRGALRTCKQKKALPRNELPIPDEDFSALEAALRERSGEGATAMLDWAAFTILAYSPIRPTSVFDLKASGMVESSRSGIFELRMAEKATGRDKRTHQLHPVVKNAIDAALEATSSLRVRAPDDLKDYVFLTPGPRRSVTVVAYGSFAGRFGALCRELGLTGYSPRSIRRRHHTKAADAAMALRGNPDDIRPLTGHATRKTDEAHYIRREDKDYYEALYGIEVGTSKIRGNPSPSEPSSLGDADLVAGESGWCESDSCAVDGAVSCLICRWFHTSPSRIPAFKALIDQIDERILGTETDHDRGHLAALKELCATYICVLETLKEDR